MPGHHTRGTNVLVRVLRVPSNVPEVFLLSTGVVFVLDRLMTGCETQVQRTFELKKSFRENLQPILIEEHVILNVDRQRARAAVPSLECINVNKGLIDRRPQSKIFCVNDPVIDQI
jgi:hypothetical protein